MATTKRHRIISLTMALLLLLSSTGFSMDVHYCNDQIKRISFFGKAPSCHQSASKATCQHAQKACTAPLATAKKTSSCQKGCCSNKTIQVEHSDDDKTLSTLELPSIQAYFLAAFVQVFLVEYLDWSKALFSPFNYAPPLLDRDLLVLIQSFLL